MISDELRVKAYAKFRNIVSCANNREVVAGDKGLGCYKLRSCKGFGVTNSGISGGRSKQQFKIPIEAAGKKKKYLKPTVPRLWFFSDASTYIDMETNKLTVSHLCHTDICCNPQHILAEELAYNQARNICPGPEGCMHSPKCLYRGNGFVEQKKRKQIILKVDDTKKMKKEHNVGSSNDDDDDFQQSPFTQKRK